MMTQSLDITAVLDKQETMELLLSLDLTLYEDVHCNLEGEFFIVTSSDELFVESVSNEDGILKFHETDVLIISNTIPENIKSHFINECEYEFITLK